ncbi:group II truncated hemoglobin [Ferrovum myxofaciens]|jgi:hemoglobin|uniref:Group 2 truncated hemoglobin YjbI n=1 Tax=Ferrovum myxofaciens TaxID=416213 RepID=A0A8F3E414_9PROT|nr:group II truncated hemoglobin [Ferrovum myxofaciens]KXW57781.1 group 2 truncated hemoglobin YjbI [Ferrovum myxofaciens]MBU6995664.1 group II truncated hemoglobin [Ferrovum myxofaciens]QKE39556.1 MAG: group II truncated hemoglobin [Ferrovum myxofaciens]QKE42153.1 MAG: group II truncated hemoglobin [Ferrovum myxofaciens]QWY74841.1 MAG: group II truncated hemoglobin [Ferrovum myxofaciens]
METINPHYENLGGEPGIRKLVEAFYHIMDTDPMATRIRQLHPEDLSSSKEKLFMFLSGWLGGPPLYIEAYGHPRLRQRHLPFPIGDEERDQWMGCMHQALEQCGLDEELKQQLIGSFSKTADFLRNKK